MSKRIVLAFDIQRSGYTDQYDTIGIGCSVVDEDFKELDKLFLPGYIKDVTKFEKGSWDNFWSLRPKLLELCTYRGDLSHDERQKEMIVAFQEFRKKWESNCTASGDELFLVSDNNVFNGGFINLMIFRYLPGVLPIPYSASSPQEYCTFFETRSQQRGLILYEIPDSTVLWELRDYVKDARRCRLPQRDKLETYSSGDAYIIACDQQMLFHE